MGAPHHLWGDKLECAGDTTTRSAGMETIKLQLNDILSTTEAKAATADISNVCQELLLLEAQCICFWLDLLCPHQRQRLPQQKSQMCAQNHCFWNLDAFAFDLT